MSCAAFPPVGAAWEDTSTLSRPLPLCVCFLSVCVDTAMRLGICYGAVGDTLRYSLRLFFPSAQQPRFRQTGLPEQLPVSFVSHDGTPISGIRVTVLLLCMSGNISYRFRAILRPIQNTAIISNTPTTESSRSTLGV